MSNPNLVVVDELNEADSRGGLGRFTIRNAVVHEAAVGERLGWQKHRECNGTGHIRGGDWRKQDGTLYGDTANTPQWRNCPDCVDGWTPPAELRERIKYATEGINAWSRAHPEMVKRIVDRILLEQARWIGEQE